MYNSGIFGQMSYIEFRNFVTFSGKYDVKFQIFYLHIISGKNVLPPPAKVE